MPAIARLPSGSCVEMLCGQPEQKNGARCDLICGVAATRSNDSSRDSRCANCGLPLPISSSRDRIARATSVGDNSPSLGNNGAPRSSLLPTTEGRRPASMLYSACTSWFSMKPCFSSTTSTS